MIIPDACIARSRGHVLLDDDNRKAYRYIPEGDHNFFFSDTYKNKSNIFWPKVKHATMEGEFSPAKNFNVVEVDYIDHVIYWPEMSNHDRKEVLLFLCDVSSYLCQNNYHIKSHMWNVVLQNGKPILLDIGDFHQNTHLPCIKATILDNIYKQPNVGGTDHTPIHPESWISNLDIISSKLSAIESIEDTATYLERAKNILEEIQLIEKSEVWDDYPVQKKSLDCKDELISYAYKHRPALCEVIKEKSPSTLLDIGCSYGLYSFFAALHGATVVGFDYSQKMISSSNKKSQEMELNCNFAYIDFLNIKSWGQEGCYHSCLERFKSEAVIVPAVIHHVHGKNKPLKQIITEWASMACKWIMLEYIPFDTSNRPISSELIVKTLSDLEFTSIKFLDSSPSPRYWILAEKK